MHPKQPAVGIGEEYFLASVAAAGQMIDGTGKFYPMGSRHDEPFSRARVARPNPLLRSLVVALVQKRLVSMVPAHDHVIQNSGSQQPWSPRHTSPNRSDQKSLRLARLESLTPGFPPRVSQAGLFPASIRAPMGLIFPH